MTNYLNLDRDGWVPCGRNESSMVQSQESNSLGVVNTLLTPANWPRRLNGSRKILDELLWELNGDLTRKKRKKRNKVNATLIHGSSGFVDTTSTI